MDKPLTTAEASAALRTGLLRLGADLYRGLRIQKTANELDRRADKADLQRLAIRADVLRLMNPVPCKSYVDDGRTRLCRWCGWAGEDH